MTHRVRLTLGMLVAFLVLSSSLVAPATHAVRIGGGTHPVLSPLVELLDALNVDVAPERCAANQTKVANHPRALVTPLGNLPSPAALPAVAQDAGFVAAFTPAHQAKAPGRSMSWTPAFYDEWLRAEPGKRIFLSYTRPDDEIARKVERILNERGYQTFRYLADNGHPKLPLNVEQLLFQQADEHLMLHTQNTRASYGVAAERLKLAKKEVDRKAQPRIAVHGRVGCSRTMETLRYIEERHHSRARFVDIEAAAAPDPGDTRQRMSRLPWVEIDGVAVDLKPAGWRQRVRDQLAKAASARAASSTPRSESSAGECAENLCLRILKALGAP